MYQNWQTEYAHYLITGNLIDAGKIKNKHFRKNLYKYRCFDKNMYWKDWAKGNLFTNFPKNFNDPFDCRINKTHETNKVMLKEALRDVLELKIKLSQRDAHRLSISDTPIEDAINILEQHGIKVSKQLFNALIIETKSSQDQFLERSSILHALAKETTLLLCGVITHIITEAFALSIFLSMTLIYLECYILLYMMKSES